MKETLPNCSEEQLNIIIKIAKRLSKKYCFGYNDVEDIEQTAILIGIKALENYNKDKGPLENFLQVHINNRLKTFKRDNHYRPDPKFCSECLGINNESCTICQKRARRIEIKKSLMSPSELDTSENNKLFLLNNNIDDDIIIEEYIEIINKKMPQKYREDYLKMLSGITVVKSKRVIIERIIKNILDTINE